MLGRKELLGLSGLVVLFLLLSTSTPGSADKLGDFVDSSLNSFAEWLGDRNNSGNPVSPLPLLFDNQPVLNVTSGAVIGNFSAIFNYSVEHSGPSNFTVSPITSLDDRLLGIRVRYDWTYFYGRYEISGTVNCGGNVPITGSGTFDLGKEKNFFGTTGMGWTNFTVEEDHVNLDGNGDVRLQRYFLVDENSGLDKLEMQGLSAAGCEPYVRASVLISLRDQLGVSSGTVHPVPLYRQLDTFLREKFAVSFYICTSYLNNSMKH